MPRGDKSAYTGKQKRQAEHIQQDYEDRGLSKHEAERRAWATVNKETGGGKKSGGGRKTAGRNAVKKAATRKVVKKAAPRKAAKKTATKKSAANKRRPK
jgi:hypothetical protein